MIENVVRASLDHGFSHVLVVTGHDAENVSRALDGYAVSIIYNPEYERGMGSSLIAGIRASFKTARSADAYLIWPADMPFIAPATIENVCETFTPESIVVPTYSGQRGHPVLFASKFRKALLSIPGHEGARSVLDRFSDAIIELPVEDAAVLRDIDTPEDLK